MKFEKSYELDDVLIRPIPSEVSSRDMVDISVKLSDNLTLMSTMSLEETSDGIGLIKTSSSS